MKLITILLQPIILSLFTCLLAFVVLPISIIALPLSQPTRLRLTAPFWKILFILTLRVILLTRVRTIDERDETSRGALLPQGLYIANHQSLMDIPLVFSHLIIPPIMKKSILYIPIFGICAYSTGALIVDRKNSESRKRCSRPLAIDY